jgi:hypothetical protein
MGAHYNLPDTDGTENVGSTYAVLEVVNTAFIARYRARQYNSVEEGPEGVCRKFIYSAEARRRSLVL